MHSRSEEFVRRLTTAQTSLYGYVLALLPDRTAAQDVLQETNLTLWRKAEEFEEGTNFLAWASKVAYFHVLSHRRKSSRDRLIFDDQLVDYLAERQAERTLEWGRRESALRECLDRLPTTKRELLERRYAKGGSVQTIAADLGKSVGAVSQSLYRIRELLLACIDRKLSSGGYA